MLGNAHKSTSSSSSSDLRRFQTLLGPSYATTYMMVCNLFDVTRISLQADLKAVSPSEEFDCSLGVDPAVKVDYKPMHKFREQTGFMSKHVTFTYRQEIEIKNTRQDDVTIHVVDKLPQSTEEKIRVSGVSYWGVLTGGRDQGKRGILLGRLNGRARSG